MNIREKHIEFIKEDTKKRGETITSDITFFGALYQCKVKTEKSTRNKTINYSAAESVMRGYRAITTPNHRG